MFTSKYHIIVLEKEIYWIFLHPLLAYLNQMKNDLNIRLNIWLAMLDLLQLLCILVADLHVA